MRPIRIVIAVYVGFASAALSPVLPAAVIWSYTNYYAADTPISGFIEFGTVDTVSAGTEWQVSDITDYAFFYNRREVASSDAPNGGEFFTSYGGHPLNRFEQDYPYLDTPTNGPPFLWELMGLGYRFSHTRNFLCTGTACANGDFDGVVPRWTARVIPSAIPELGTYFLLAWSAVLGASVLAWRRLRPWRSAMIAALLPAIKALPMRAKKRGNARHTNIPDGTYRAARS